jgi:hypothetical protein
MDAKNAIKVGVIDAEHGYLLLVLPLPDGGHTYERIDNPLLMSLIRNERSKLLGQRTEVLITIEAVQNLAANEAE